MNRTSKLLVTGALLILGAASYGAYVFALRAGPDEGALARSCPHMLTPAACPFCTPARLETEGWCAAHGVPEAVCTRCHAELIAAFQAQGDWCAEHALPESQCVACDPARAASPPTAPAAGPTCKHGAAREVCFVCDPTLVERRGQCAEHGVPEALCTRCDPAVIPVFQATYDWCAEHGLPETQCVLCNPRAAAAPPPPPAPLSPAERRRAAPTAGCRLHQQRIRLASGRVAEEVGIETVAASRGPLRERVAVTAEVVYAADQHAELSPRAAGTLAELQVGLGDPVEAGAVLAWIDAPELGAARAALVNAARLLEAAGRTHARELELVAQGVGTQRAVIEADTRRVQAAAALLEAEQRLRALGLAPEEIEAARAAPAGPARLALRAPFAGVVTALDAAPGEAVAPGRPLLTVADTRTLWALLDVPEGAIARVALEQPVVVSLAALPGERFTGRISWISSAIDRRTRTLEARAELANPQGRLRANMFGAADVLLSDRRDALLVPAAAVQWEGCCHVVFLPSGEGAYLPRKVQLGGAAGAHVEVLTGLDEGDHVVTTGAFLLKTELLAGSIGAGCCEPVE